MRVNIFKHRSFFFWLQPVLHSFFHRTTKMRTQSHPWRVAHSVSAGHLILSRTFALFPLFRHCMSWKSFTLHFQTRLISENEDWLDPITCCHPVMLLIVFFVGFFCLAISALPELTMWPAMYYLEIKKAVIFLYQY